MKIQHAAFSAAVVLALSSAAEGYLRSGGRRQKNQKNQIPKNQKEQNRRQNNRGLVLTQEDMENNNNGVSYENHDMNYAPLSCNNDIDAASCDSTTFSSLVASSSSTPGSSAVVVPCGTCVTVDIVDGSKIELPRGLEVLGKLHFPSSSNVVLNTTHVFVQGILSMDEPSEGNEVRINFYGTDHQCLLPAMMCGGEGTGMELDEDCIHKHEVGKKAFVVAGGKLDIQAIDPSCPSWTKLHDVADNTQPSALLFDGTFEDRDVGDVPWTTLVTTLWGDLDIDLEVVDAVESHDDGDGNIIVNDNNKALSQSNRLNDYTGLTVKVDRSKLVNTYGMDYKLSFRYKISYDDGGDSSSSPFSPDVSSYLLLRSTGSVTNGPTRYGNDNEYIFHCDGDGTDAEGRAEASDVWTTCYADVHLKNDHSYETAVPNVRFHLGYKKEVDIVWDDISFHRAGYSSSSSIVVSSEFGSCVREGDDILVTSHVPMGWDKEIVSAVSSVQIDHDAGTATLIIAPGVPEGIPTLTSLDPVERVFAVEVARLSRRVIFEADQELYMNMTTGQMVDEDAYHGGHLMMMHTPDVVQRLSGVEIRGFGQHGFLGRYPIHIHMSGDVSGTVISKNVIRHSNQRCINIHGSNNVLVSDNVAHDSFGHCMALEDGAEVGNVFERNLVARTKVHKVEMLVSMHTGGLSTTFENNGTSEVSGPSSFWITNTLNNFTGNVAAGSQVHGFWFDTKQFVRGPSYHVPGNDRVEPETQGLIAFKDNAAHSNGRKGITMYQPGWLPENGAALENVASYKNHHGIFFHRNRNIVVRNSIFADNKVSVRHFVNRYMWNTLEDSIIMAKSNDAKSREGNDVGCFGGGDSSSSSVTGVQFAYNDAPGTQLRLHNVTFGNFDPDSISCPGGVLALSPWETQGQGPVGEPMEIMPTLKDIAFSPPAVDNSFDIPCSILDGDGREDIFLEDVDGGMGPTGNPGFFLQDAPSMKTFVDPSACHDVRREGSCADYCDGVCLRKLFVSARPIEDIEGGGGGVVDYEMVITNGLASQTFEKGAASKHPDRFDAVLPAGNYRIKFVSTASGEPVHPAVDSVTFGEEPRCSGYITEKSIMLPLKVYQRSALC
uniref:G8 domain-containing protein n=1 Tax=Odontella aurita TaxID=265563 RepID=A0A7S4JV21_9STRA|mmetsp:Transcript_54910/g.164407  ORF Transcript_54910/g.164407 Transcript_54910/m.164407 type:complete len:1111 (+) Transcript_54910:52-3384(+)